MRQEHDTKITNEYFENPVEVKYLLMSEPNRLSPEYKTVVLPTHCYEGFEGQQQLAIVLYCLKISTDYFDVGLPYITDMLAVLYNWQLQNQKSASIHHFLSTLSVLYHIQCNSYTLTLAGQAPFFSGCLSHECQLSEWKDGYTDRWVVETSWLSWKVGNCVCCSGLQLVSVAWSSNALVSH
jgi:hypothetical protein